MDVVVEGSKEYWRARYLTLEASTAQMRALIEQRCIGTVADTDWYECRTCFVREWGGMIQHKAECPVGVALLGGR